MGKTITLSEAEHKLLEVFFGLLDEAFGNSGCNEISVPFSPEMLSLVQEAERSAYGAEYEESDVVYVNRETKEQKIYSMDHVLLDYLKTKLDLK